MGLLKPVAKPCPDFADHVEANWPGISKVPVLRLLCEPSSDIGDNGRARVADGIELVFKKFRGRLSIGFGDELNGSELGRLVDFYIQKEPSSPVCTLAMSMWSESGAGSNG
jgi:hypothetical protein